MIKDWKILPFGWNKWGVYIDNRLVASATERRLCVKFLKLPEHIRMTKIVEAPLAEYCPYDLEAHAV